MEKKLVQFLLAFFFSISIVSAACIGNNLDPDDTILRISNLQNYNGHAAFGNQGPSSPSTYTKDICYPDLFSIPTPTGSGLRDCTGKSPLVWLSDVTNAHGSLFPIPGYYENPVCFADMQCVPEFTPSNNNTCINPNKVVAFRLNSDSNAHFGIGNSGQNNEYPIKVCCTTGGILANLDYRWENAAGNPIDTARLGDSVFAVAVNYDGGADPTFDIFHESTTNNIINSAPGSLHRTNDWSYNWNTNQYQSQIINAPSSSPSTKYKAFQFEINDQPSNWLEITFCGDNRLQGGFEQCDDGIKNGVACTTSGCPYCTEECTIEWVGTFCGNGVREGLEECDEGVNNNVVCVPPAGGGSCEYCTADCKEQKIGTNIPGPYTGKNSLWLNLAGEIIDKARETDTVQMLLINGENGSLRYEIYNEETGTNPLIATKFGEIRSPHAIGSWVIPSKDTLLRQTGSNPSETFDEVYFDIDNEKSNDLNLSFKKADDPIRIQIISPKCGSVEKMPWNTLINFTVLDRNDLIRGNVTIEGAPNNPVYEFSGPGKTHSFRHIFTEDGTKQIRIYAETYNGKDRASAISNVIIVGNTNPTEYTAACITHPRNYQYITTDYARFDASTSVAVEASISSGTLSQSPIASSSVEYKWVFSDRRTHNAFEDDDIAYKFFKYFGSYGPNWADLKVEVI